MRQKTINVFKLDVKERRLYFKLLFVSLLYVLPIVIADVRYNDDMARSLYGLTGWYGDGRPLGELLIEVLCGGNPIVDLAPFPLLLSVAVLSYALVLYNRKYLDFVSNDAASVLLLSVVLMNPFAMSNLSYRFDSIIMFSALSIPFLLFAMPDAAGKVETVIYSTAAGVVMMTLYQPVLGMCIILFGIHIFFCAADKRDIFPGLYRMGGIGIGAAFYKLIVARRFITSQHDWRYAASKIVPLSPRSISIMGNNVVECCRYIKNCIWQMPYLYRAALAAMFLIAVVTALFHVAHPAKKTGSAQKILAGCAFVILPFFIFTASFLPMIVLAQMGMRSRIFISLGGFPLFLGIMLIYFNRERLYVNLLLAVFFFSQMAYMFSYGNALKSQNEYEKYMVYSIVHDVETLNGNGEYEQLSFAGATPRARELSMICSKYPFFNEIVPIYFGNSTWIGGAWVYHYMQDEMYISELSEEEQEYLDTAEPVLKNARYACYVYADKIIVCFR